MQKWPALSPQKYEIGKGIEILPEICFFPGMLEEGPQLFPLPGCTGEPWHDCELSASKVHQLDLPVPSFWTRTNLLCSERLCRIEFWNEKDTRSNFKMCHPKLSWGLRLRICTLFSGDHSRGYHVLPTCSVHLFYNYEIHWFAFGRLYLPPRPSPNW